DNMRTQSKYTPERHQYFGQGGFRCTKFVPSYTISAALGLMGGVLVPAMVVATIREHHHNVLVARTCGNALTVQIGMDCGHMVNGFKKSGHGAFTGRRDLADAFNTPVIAVTVFGWPKDILVEPG